MIYKLMIVVVDEEVRQGIITNVDWNRYGIKVIGQAENGLKALEIIEAEVPDVVISDSCMPFLDGIELAEILQNLYPLIKMVVLTGFDDFRFAQQAIKFGVSNFILKPVQQEDLNQLIDKIKKKDIPNKRVASKPFEVRKECVLSANIKYGNEKDIITAVNHFFSNLVKIRESRNVHNILFIEAIAELIRLVKVLHLEQKIERHFLEEMEQFLDSGTTRTMQENKAFIVRVSLSLYQHIKCRRVCATQLLLEKAKDFIESSYHDPELTIQKLADQLYISSSYLSFLFKKYDGKTFLQYLIEVRLDAARELLADANLRICDVAVRVGCSDASYFSYFFKRYTGITPREYRNQIFQKNDMLT